VRDAHESVDVDSAAELPGSFRRPVLLRGAKTPSVVTMLADCSAGFPPTHTPAMFRRSLSVAKEKATTDRPGPWAGARPKWGPRVAITHLFACLLVSCTAGAGEHHLTP
jgi:hypothetical protein